MSALHEAATNNHWKCVEYFLTHPMCNVNIQDELNGETPLMYAIKAGNNKTVSIFSKSKKIDILNVQDKLGRNALDFSVYHGETTSFIILLQTLIKRSNVQNWNQLIKSNIINISKIDHWYKLMKSSNSESLKLEYFLNQLKNDIFNNKNGNYNNSNNNNNSSIELLEALLSSYYTDDNSSIQQKIRSNLEEYEKLNAITDTLMTLCDKDALAKFCQCVNTMIDKKLPLNDTLLMISLKHDAQQCKNNLINTLETCLSVNITDTEKDDGKKVSDNGKTDKERSIAWYKETILNSNVLCHRMESTHTNINGNVNSTSVEEKQNGNGSGSTNGDASLLFDEIDLGLIEKQLIKQREYIHENILKMEKEFCDDWQELVNFSTENLDLIGQMCQIKLINRYNYSNTNENMMINGIKSEYNNNNLIFDYRSGFNASEEYDKHCYLTKLLIYATNVNPVFQNDCEKILNENVLGVKCIFKKAPVKTKTRCITKAAVDYYDRNFPQSSNILGMYTSSHKKSHVCSKKQKENWKNKR